MNTKIPDGYELDGLGRLQRNTEPVMMTIFGRKIPADQVNEHTWENEISRIVIELRERVEALERNQAQTMGPMIPLIGDNLIREIEASNAGEIKRFFENNPPDPIEVKDPK